MVAAFLITARMFFEPKRWPDLKLENLRHPLYSPGVDAAELEGFMQFAGYTNIEKENPDGEWVPSYDPLTDFNGPGSLMPTQCFSGDPNKYASPVIALVKQGTELESDLYG